MTKCPSKACICVVLTLWITLGLIILIICSFLYLKPFIKVSRYKQTTCTVEGGFYTTQFICKCGSGCRSSYPCYLVHVSLNKSSSDRNWVVILYKDNEQLKDVIHSDHDMQEQCSLRLCNRDSNVNRVAVSQFKRWYGRTGKQVACWYDPLEIRAGATLYVAPPGLDVLHILLWPFLFTLVGILLCVVFCKRCKIIDHSKDIPEKDIELTAVVKPEVQKLVPQKSEDEDKKLAKKKKKDDKGKGKSNKRSSQKEPAAVPLAERLAAATPLTAGDNIKVKSGGGTAKKVMVKTRL